MAARRLLVAGLLAPVALLAGCGAQSSSGAGEPVPSGASLSPVPGLSPRPTPSGRPPATPAPAPGGTLVAVSTSGGLAGLSRSVVVAADGTVTRTVRGTPVPAAPLAPEQVATLRSAVEQADLASLQRYYGERDVADGITTQVTAGGRTVTLYTGGERPQPLQQLVDTVERLTS